MTPEECIVALSAMFICFLVAMTFMELSKPK